MEAPHVVQRCSVQVFDAADHRAPVGVLGEGIRCDGIEQQAVRAGQHALAKLLLHHRALALEAGFVHIQVRQALGLGPQQALQVVGGHHVLVGGHVLRGEGVVVAAHVFRQPVELLGLQVAGALEHQVLKQVGKARAAFRVVLAAHPVPDLHAHAAGAGGRQGQHLQAIGQHPPGEGQRWHLQRRVRRRLSLGWRHRHTLLWRCRPGHRAHQHTPCGQSHPGQSLPTVQTHHRSPIFLLTWRHAPMHRITTPDQDLLRGWPFNSTEALPQSL